MSITSIVCVNEAPVSMNWPLIMTTFLRISGVPQDKSPSSPLRILERQDTDNIPVYNLLAFFPLKYAGAKVIICWRAVEDNPNANLAND